MEQRAFQSILAIDKGSRCGWAMRGRTGHISHGVVTLPPAHGEDYGRLFNAYRAWLRGMIAVERPDVIWFERAQINDHSSQSAAVILMGLVGHTLEICWDKKIPWKHIYAVTVRKFICGSGRAKKDDVGFAIRQLGYQIGDHNECDALAVLHYAIDHPIALSQPVLFVDGRAA